jgi:hypothetical protein
MELADLQGTQLEFVTQNQHHTAEAKTSPVPMQRH